MQLSQYLKGRINITDFDDMPFYMLHSIYYNYWLYMEENKNKPESQKGAEAISEVIENSI